MSVAHIKSSRTTIRLPKQMKMELHSRVVAEGYGLRGKSMWVCESINQLVEIDGFEEYVSIASELSDLMSKEVFVFDPSTRENLDKAFLIVRHAYPTLEGVQSMIVRAGILQRLLRSPLK